MPPATLTSVAREHMADAILSMQDACHDDGLAYAEEMTALVLAWLYTRRAQGKGGEILIDAPCPDADQDSPGHLLLRHAANTPPGRISVRDLPPPPSIERPPPPPPEQRPKFTRVPNGTHRALDAQLHDMLLGTRGPIRVRLTSITINSLRTRCTRIGKLSRSHYLSVHVVGDHAIVSQSKR